MNNDMNSGGWIMMGVGMVLFWGLVIFGVVWLVQNTGSDRRSGSSEDASAERSAIETLDRRLAEGKIDAEDYKERRKMLTGST